jgi:hypothetical protein
MADKVIPTANKGTAIDEAHHRDHTEGQQPAIPLHRQRHLQAVSGTLLTVSGTLPQVAVPSSQVAVPSSQVTAPLRLPTDGGTLITGHCILQAGSGTLKVQMKQQKKGRSLKINLQQEEIGQQQISFSKQDSNNYDRLGLRPHT